MKIKNSYDVVIIGSGGAGLRSAIEAASNGAKTLVICRGKVNRSGATLLAGANISADIACDGQTLAKLGISDKLADDTPEKWFDDIVKEGFYLNNQDLVKMYTETAGERLSELIEWGLKVRGMEGGREISAFASDILETLYQKAKLVGVEFLEDTIFTDLIEEKGQIKGVICLSIVSGELVAYGAKAVILCTGGAHNIFSENSGSSDLCGEGQGAAWRAGAELIDMEMISFCPTVTISPTMYKGNILPYIFITTGYGKLVNKYGQTFTHKYLSPKVEDLALNTEWNKMLLSYAVQSEILAGNSTKNGGVYFTLPMHPVEIMEELYEDLPSLTKGMYADIMKIFKEGRSFTVQPSAHYFEGGIRITVSGETNVKGLFAAGECSGGVFGANRVSAATTEMLVEGAKAGKYAAEYASTQAMQEIEQQKLDQLEEELYKPFTRTDGVEVTKLKAQLHEITRKSLSVIRCEKELLAAQEKCTVLEEQLNKVYFRNKEHVCNKEWREFLELRNMIPITKAILKSALLRKESRGVHIRSDYFCTNNSEYLCNIVLKGENFEEQFVPAVTNKIKPHNETVPYTDYIQHVIESLN